MPKDVPPLQRPRIVPGIVVRGYGIASGTASDSPYPSGSVPLQLPHFRRLGLDLTAFHPATLNVSIAPRRFRLTNPRHTFRRLRWIDGFPPEDFSFSPCRVRFRAVTYVGVVYRPHPETKERHHQDPSVVEVIADYVPGIRYGDRVELELEADEVVVLEE